MDEHESPNGPSAGQGGGADPSNDVLLPPPLVAPLASPAPSGWAANQPVPAPQTYWGDPEPPRPPPPPGTEYAGVGRRFVAWLIDLVPVVVVAVILLWPVGSDFFEAIFRALPDSPRPSREAIQAAMAGAFASAVPGLLRASALIQLGSVVYLCGSWLVFSRSPGMAILGMRIVREENGDRLELGRVAVRYAGYLLSAGAILIGFAWAIFDERKQTWHDKLAGTLVVRNAPIGSISANQARVTSTSEAAQDARRPSIGAMAETTWHWYRRWAADLLSSLAFILIPMAIVLLPLIGALLVVGQDLSVATVQGMVDIFANVSDPSILNEYNRRVLAASAPTYAVSAMLALVSGVTTTLILGGTAAALDDGTNAGPVPNVRKLVAARLPALAAIGLLAGVAGAGVTLMIGLPAFSPAMAGDVGAANIGVAIAALALLVGVPVGIYLSVIWMLAIIAVVQEDLDAIEALRRARALSRHRTRWLIGVILVSGLIYAAVVYPVGALPTGLLSEAYLEGQRLPIALSVALTGALALVTMPAMFVLYVESFRAARDDAAPAALAS